MKRILFLVLIANALIILGLSSCKKESISSIPPGNTTPIIPATTTSYMVASRWVSDGHGIFVHTFQNVISPANSTNRSVRIYLVSSGKETRINHFISFMGGELWGTSTDTDVRINYRISSQILPFSYLVIKVVVE